MDTNWFQQALMRARVSQADLARHLALAPSAVSRMLKGERQMKLNEAVQVASILGVSQEEVLRYAGAVPDRPAPSQPARRGRPPRSPGVASTPSRSEAIPIRGGAPAGGDEDMFVTDAPIGWTTRIASLSGVRDAYAMYMTGSTMQPRYSQGWLLHVNPFKPPVTGRDVVVHKINRACVVGQFVRRSNDALLLRRLNPEGELRIPSSDIAECHLIVGVDQEG